MMKFHVSSRFLPHEPCSGPANKKMLMNPNNDSICKFIYPIFIKINDV